MRELKASNEPRPNEVKCYALAVEEMAIKNFLPDMELIKKVTDESKSFVGLYIEPHTYKNYLIFDSMQGCIDAYNEINNACMDGVIVKIVDRPIFVEKQYMRVMRAN